MLARKGHSKILSSFYIFVREKKNNKDSPLQPQTCLEDELARQKALEPLAWRSTVLNLTSSLVFLSCWDTECEYVPPPGYKGRKPHFNTSDGLSCPLENRSSRTAIPMATSKGSFLCHFPAVSQIMEGNQHKRATTEQCGGYTARSSRNMPSRGSGDSVGVKCIAHPMIPWADGFLLVTITALQRETAEIAKKVCSSPSPQLLLANQWKDFSQKTEYPIIPSREQKIWCDKYYTYFVPHLKYLR